jgi:hypothetical protein
MTDIPVTKACPAWMTPEVCEELLGALGEGALVMCVAANNTAELDFLPKDYRLPWISAHMRALDVLAEVERMKGVPPDA